jgi:hypothetical protein
VVAALPGRVPLDPSREQARAWAVEELAGREYRTDEPGLVQRALQWLLDRLSGVEVPGGPVAAVGLVVLALVVAVVLGLVLRRVGLPGRTARRGGDRALYGATGPRSAAEHRAAAERAAAEGDVSTAVLERFRAVVRDLEERAVLTEQPGRTADEAARAAGALLPDLAGDLRAGARSFADVRYGDRAATPAAVDELARLDDAVRRARPARPDRVPAPS